MITLEHLEALRANAHEAHERFMEKAKQTVATGADPAEAILLQKKALAASDAVLEAGDAWVRQQFPVDSEALEKLHAQRDAIIDKINMESSK